MKANDFFKTGEDLSGYRTSEVSIKSLSDATIVDRDFKHKDLTLSYEVSIKAKKDSETATTHNFSIVIPFLKGVMQEQDISVDLS